MTMLLDGPHAFGCVEVIRTLTVSNLAVQLLTVSVVVIMWPARTMRGETVCDIAMITPGLQVATEGAALAGDTPSMEPAAARAAVIGTNKRRFMKFPLAGDFRAPARQPDRYPR
jgi:hypothetical protein